jgi:hypothetical protein
VRERGKDGIEPERERERERENRDAYQLKKKDATLYKKKERKKERCVSMERKIKVYTHITYTRK